MVFEVRRKIVKKKVVTPIKNSSFLDAKTAAIAFISPRIVGIGLLHLHRQVEEIIPGTADAVEQLRADAVVDNLEEAPVAAGVGDLGQNGGSKLGVVCSVQIEAVDVDDWDVDGGGDGGGGGTVRRRLDVAAGDDRAAAFGEGLDSDYGFGPILVEASHHGQ